MPPLGDDLRPRRIFTKISEVTPEVLSELGAKAVAVDLDNTLAYDATFRPFDDAIPWVEAMRSAGIPVILFTNTYHLRAKIMGRKFGLRYVSPGRKPAPDGYHRCASILGIELGDLAMIGDQLFTDIRGANNAGAISILVRPRHREILLHFRYKKLRRLENIYLRNMETEKPI